MKNKRKNKLTYILLPAVVLIWTLIAYKFFKGNDTSTVGLQPYSKTPIEQLAYKNKMRHTLNLSYQDPFLKTASAVLQKEHSSKSNNITNEAPPIIHYNGFVKNQKTQQAYLRINEKVFLAQSNKVYNGIRVYKILPDSILVSFNNKKLWVTKN